LFVCFDLVAQVLNQGNAERPSFDWSMGAFDNMRQTSGENVWRTYNTSCRWGIFTLTSAVIEKGLTMIKLSKTSAMIILVARAAVKCFDQTWLTSLKTTTCFCSFRA
jgi:hypothetical protein